MNLTSVRYQDSCIYIDLDGSQNKRENEAFLKKIRIMYVTFKVKAFDRYGSTTLEGLILGII